MSMYPGICELLGDSGVGREPGICWTQVDIIISEYGHLFQPRVKDLSSKYTHLISSQVFIFREIYCQQLGYGHRSVKHVFTVTGAWRRMEVNGQQLVVDLREQ